MTIMSYPTDESGTLVCNICQEAITRKATATVEEGAITGTAHPPCANPKVAKVAAAKPEPTLCGCGCGQYPKNPKSRFIQGHDAKYHSAVKAAAKQAEETAQAAAETTVEEAA